jgi:hypothetical protein
MRRYLPSPAMVVALLALLVALGGTAIAANVVPLANHARVADNAKKLQGKNPAQLAAMPSPATTLDGKTADQIADTPGPASTIADTIVVKTESATVEGFGTTDASVECSAGQKAIAGGWETPSEAAGSLFGFDSRPSSNGAAWKLRLASATDVDVQVTLYAICVK